MKTNRKQYITPEANAFLIELCDLCAGTVQGEVPNYEAGEGDPDPGRPGSPAKESVGISWQD
jgi:hypothetical protein